MLIEFLIGYIIGLVFVGVVIGICECINYARRLFAANARAKEGGVIKVGSSGFDRIVRDYPGVRAALEGDTTAIAYVYGDDGKLHYRELNNELSSDFDGCSGYRMTRDDVEHPIKVW